MTAAGFEFATAGRIIAGAGRAADLPDVLAGLGDQGAGVRRREPGAP